MTPAARFRLLIGVSLICFLAAAGLYVSLLITRPLDSLREGVVEIKRGWSLSQITSAFFGGRRLQGGCFKIHALITGNSRRLRAGEYLLERDSIRSLTRKLVEGRVLQYRVTIAEGLWAQDLAALLAGANLGDRDRLIGLVRDPAFARRLLGTDAPSLEGYLFPETYFFTKGMPEEEILRVFVNRFNDKARPYLTADTALSLHQALTLASLVEREAKMPDERPVIAAVFLNRLKKRMPLESCVTVEYALGAKKKILTDGDLLVTSPYNTYRHMGLPPGPVCNPGLDSIRAVLAPASTDALFFVALGDGRHIFSKSWAEHKLAKKKVRQKSRQLLNKT